MKLLKTLPLLLMSVMFSCSNGVENEIESKVQQMTDIADFGSVKYTIKKVVKANDVGEWYKIGDRKILFNCTAYLKAGINLQNLTMEKFQLDHSKKEAIITLPHATLLSINMPPEETKMAFSEVSMFRFDFTAEERTSLLRQGEKDIVDDIENIGILKEAEENASMFFKAMLSQLGFKKVVVNFE